MRERYNEREGRGGGDIQRERDVMSERVREREM